MKITFDITSEDLMAFNRYFYDTDKEIGNRIWLLRILWPVLFLILGFVLYLPVFRFYFGAVAVLWFVFYPMNNRKKWMRRVTKEIVKPENAIWLGKREMEIDDEKVSVTFDKGEETVLWSAFIKSVETLSHFFLFQTPRQALIVPKHAMTEIQVDETRQLLNNKIKK